MTKEQATKVGELATVFKSLNVREDHETGSVFVDAYNVTTPDRCQECGDDHLDHLADLGHYFKLAPVAAQFRVAPSGFRQRIDPLPERQAA